jgi:hypothetical protein
VRAELSTSLRFAVILASAALLAGPGIPDASASGVVLRPACSPAALIAAIQRANTTRAADTIVLKAGCTYTLTRGPFHFDNGPDGLPIVVTPLTVHGNGATIARALGAPAFRFFEVNDSETSLKIDHLTLRGGSLPASKTGEPGYGGGAINVTAGALSVSASKFVGNTAGRGGDATQAATDGSQGGGGGAIFAWYGAVLTVTDSTFRGNAAGPGGRGTRAGGNGGDGGAISVDYAKTARITRSTFTSNVGGAGGPGSNLGGVGGRGGAIYGGTALTVVESVFSLNRAGGVARGSENVGGFGTGGAISAWANLTVTRSRFTGNQAFQAGAIWTLHNLVSGVTSISNSTFSGNTSEQAAGAIVVHRGTVNVTNSTFVANHGGLGATLGNWGTLHVTNSTIAGNGTSGDIAGILAIGTTTVSNTIVADNVSDVVGGSAQNCGGDDGTLIEGGGNLRWPVSDPTCFGTYGDPKLLPLGDYGGAVQTMDLGSGSAALDAGLDAVCMAPIGSIGQGAGGIDARGIGRSKGTHCDIGAVEHVTLHHLFLAPSLATIDYHASQAYTAEGRGAANEDLGDLTASTTFSIAPDGTCTGRTCKPAVPGDHVVTGNDGSITGTAALKVPKMTQRISFAQPADATVAQSPRLMAATASSGLVVAFASATPAVCAVESLSGGSIVLLHPGICTIVARQPGDAYYLPAPAVKRSFTVR